jgi:hypothetical protein
VVRTGNAITPVAANGFIQTEKTTMKKFDVQKELAKAVRWLLDEMATGRKAYDYDNPPAGCHGKSWLCGRPHFTATDLERRLRAAAAEVLNGLAYGSQGIDTYHPVRLSLGRDVLSVCRRFLAGQVARGVLRADQPSGKHTCTGLRFRPAAADLTEAERRTRESAEEQKNRGPIVHYEPGRAEGDWSSKRQPLCRANRKPHRFCSYRSHRRIVRTTGNIEAVTCKVCRKLAAKEVAS